MSHEGLFLKLLRLGIGGPYYHVIKDMYTKVTASVHCKSVLTDTFNVYKGLKQGDILSPLLFNIFINDIMDEFQSKNSYPPFLIEQQVGSLLYADDLVIFSTSPEGLQNSLDNLDSYCKNRKLSVNLKKCKSMCFTKQGHDT